MNTEKMIEIEFGDLYEWRYKDEAKHLDHLNYWCCTRIARATKTHLVDLYWSDGGGSRGVETFEDAKKKWILKFIANFDDLDLIKDWESIYYKPEDIVNLNHSNNTRGQMYRRRGSKRDREVMVDYAKRCLESYKHQAESASRSVKEYEQKVADILEVKTDLNKVYLQMPR